MVYKDCTIRVLIFKGNVDSYRVSLSATLGIVAANR